MSLCVFQKWPSGGLRCEGGQRFCSAHHSAVLAAHAHRTEREGEARSSGSQAQKALKSNKKSRQVFKYRCTR